MMYTKKQSRGIATMLIGSVGLALSACTSTDHRIRDVAPSDTGTLGRDGARLDGQLGASTSAPEAAGDTAPVAVVEELLVKLPGVEVTRIGSRIRIRLDGLAGAIYTNSEPLFVIDGSPLLERGTAQVLSIVHGRDIARIEYVKAGSASSKYGQRGRNGVIVITTSGP